MNAYERPLTHRVMHAMSQLGHPISPDDATALAATLQRDHIVELYFAVTDASICISGGSGVP